MTTLTVCVPTAKRPTMIERLLENLTHQTRQPDEILIVDASQDEQTRQIVEQWQSHDGAGAVRWIPSKLGLPLQRAVGIEHCRSELICMLDDDVLLETQFLSVMENFLLSPEGQRFGGMAIAVASNVGRRAPIAGEIGLQACIGGLCRGGGAFGRACAGDQQQACKGGGKRTEHGESFSRRMMGEE